jgi:hypothetical protein
MAYTPNYDCANFCYWMLNLSWQRLTGPQTVLVNTVYSAALAQTTVTDQQWKDFTMISAWRSKYYESWGKYASYYNANCQSWLNNLPSAPPAWYTAIINQFFQDLADAGIDSALDRLFIFAGPSEGISLVSLINPSATPASNPTATTFTPYNGYTGNGSSMYIDCSFNMSTNGVNYTLNDASLGVYLRKNASSASSACVIAGQSGGNYAFIQPRYTGNVCRATINSGAFPTMPANTTTQGLFAVSRSSSTTHTIWKNGSALTSVASASGALPNSATTVLSRVGSDFSDNQVSMAFMGAGSMNQANLYSAFQALMTRLGSQV